MRKVKLKMFMCVLSCFICVQLFTTLCTIAHQASLYMGFLSKNTGVGSHSLLQGDPPKSGIEPTSHYVPALAGGLFITVYH